MSRRFIVFEYMLLRPARYINIKKAPHEHTYRSHNHIQEDGTAFPFATPAKSRKTIPRKKKDIMMLRGRFFLVIPTLFHRQSIRTFVSNMLTTNARRRRGISAHPATSLVTTGRLLVLRWHVHAIGRIHAWHTLTSEVSWLHHWRPVEAARARNW